MASTQSLQSGTTLLNGMFRIERVLGQGGFGITYLALDLHLKKLVAIKEFFLDTLSMRDSATGHVRPIKPETEAFINKYKAKFIKEARSLAGLSHPNLVSVQSAFDENGTAYYVMDYIEGGNLQERVKANGPLPMEEAMGYIEQIAGALDYLHERKLNHLDVKPNNIMRRADGTVELIDFGLAKQYDSSGNQLSTTPVGISNGFAPLEQYTEGGLKTFSPSTDVYALGATLYVLLTGEVPPTATELVDSEVPMPDIVPEGVQKVIRKAMSPSRKDRYQSAAEFVKALKNPKPEKSKTLRRRLIACGVGLIVAAAIVLTIIFGSRGGSDTELSVNSGDGNIDVSEKSSGTAKDGMPDKGEINGHEYVDLGLSVKWATCNIGAKKPSDYGNYYSWGETAPKKEYHDGNSLTKGKKMEDIAASDNDVAHVDWGASWRMPSRAEWEELAGKCKWEWTKLDGTPGCRVTGINGNSIFLPAGGSMGLNSVPNNFGERGYYWTSSLYIHDDFAWMFYFIGTTCYTADDEREYGNSVRAVAP